MEMPKPITLSEMLALDPQMAVPEYPRLSEDVLKIWDSQNVLITYGSASPVVFGGKAGGAILPHLLPLMNGENSVSMIADKLVGIPSAHLQKAISLMYMKGMIENGIATNPIDVTALPAFRPQLHFYGRYLDFTRVFHNRYDVLHHLRSCRVLMLTDCARAPVLVSELAAFGLACVELYAPSALHAECAAVAPASLAMSGRAADIGEFLDTIEEDELQGYDLICLLLENDSPQLAKALNRKTRGNSTRIAYTVLGQDRIQIGPVMQKPHSGCFECAQMHSFETATPASHNGIALDYACQFVAVCYLALMTQFVPITTMDQIQILTPESMTFASLPLYKQPACPGCGKTDDAAVQSLQGIITGSGLSHPLPWFYNENTNFKKYQMVPKGHQAHYDEKNKRAVAGAFKKIGNAREERISATARMPASLTTAYSGAFAGVYDEGSEAEPVQRMNMLMTLSASRMVHSISEDMRIGFRITPSAGAMSSQNLYLVNIGLDGLDRGAFYFSPGGGLQRIHERAVDLETLGVRTKLIDTAEMPAAMIVVTESYARVESKYLGISYRYVLSDAGAMFATLMSIAPRLGFEVRHTGQFFDDKLSQELGCTAVTEIPVLVCFLYDTAANASSADQTS
jgi:SagB-type dehydrogenase family enzyme